MLIRVFVILLISALLGIGTATFRGLPWKPDVNAMAQRAALGDAVERRQKELRASVGVNLDQFKALIAQGAVVIDARAREDYEKAHLRTDFGAPVLNVEPEHIGENLNRLNELLGQPLVLYCNSDTCELAEMLYIRLEENGFSGMKIFFPGWEGITAAKLDTVAGPDRWTGSTGVGQPPAGEENADPSDSGASETQTGEAEHE